MIKKENLPECPVATTVQLIGSKWKLLILRDLLTGKKRLKQSQKDLEIQRAAYEEGRRKYAEQKELEYVQGVLEERQAEYERLTANLHDRITTRDKYK